MIVVRVELWSAVTGAKTELARMHICNVGGDLRRRNYQGQTFKGRSKEALDKRQVQRTGTLTGWRSLDLHIWNLVAAMLAGMGYGAPKAPTFERPAPDPEGDAPLDLAVAALRPFTNIDGEGSDDFGDDTRATLTFGRTTHYALTLGHLRVASTAMRAIEDATHD